MVNQFDVGYWCVVVGVEVVFQQVQVVVWMVCVVWVQDGEQVVYGFVVVQVGEGQMVVGDGVDFGQGDQWFGNVVQFFGFWQGGFDQFVFEQ